MTIQPSEIGEEQIRDLLGALSEAECRELRDIVQEIALRYASLAEERRRL